MVSVIIIIVFVACVLWWCDVSVDKNKKCCANCHYSEVFVDKLRCTHPNFYLNKVDYNCVCDFFISNADYYAIEEAKRKIEYDKVGYRSVDK